MKTIVKNRGTHLFRSISVNNEDDDGVSLLTMEQFDDVMSKKEMLKRIAKAKKEEDESKIIEMKRDCKPTPISDCHHVTFKENTPTKLNSKTIQESRQVPNIRETETKSYKPRIRDSVQVVENEDFSISSKTNSLLGYDDKSIATKSNKESIWRSIYNVINGEYRIPFDDPIYCCGLEIRVVESDDNMTAVETLYTENGTECDVSAQITIEAYDKKEAPMSISHKPVGPTLALDYCGESTGVATYRGDGLRRDCSQKDSVMSDDNRYSKKYRNPQNDSSSLQLSCERDLEKIKRQLNGESQTELADLNTDVAVTKCKKSYRQTPVWTKEAENRESSICKDVSSEKRACHLEDDSGPTSSSIGAKQKFPSIAKASSNSASTPSEKKTIQAQTKNINTQKTSDLKRGQTKETTSSKNHDHVQTLSQGKSKFKIKFRMDNIHKTKQKTKNDKKQILNLPQQEQSLGKILDPDVFLKIQSTAKDELKPSPKEQKNKRKKKTKYVQRLSKGIK